VLRYIVVIPVYCEPGITTALESLWNSKRPASGVEVIIVVNSPDNASPDVIAYNRSTVDALKLWIDEHDHISMKFRVIDVRLPAKDAGVGMARRTGMDEAASRFKKCGDIGYILSFDADSTCDSNYFTALDEAIREKPATKGFNIYFEHPVSGNEFPEKVYQGIIQYELHLRYVNLFLKQTGFPYAYHTVGSCFGVRSDIYTAQGGMNRKKGGEDFYFLHKVIPLGNFEVINTTCVRPSPRESFRVPFGTGPVIKRFVESGEELTTYAPEIFSHLKVFMDMIPGFYKAGSETVKTQIELLPGGIKAFLYKNNIQSAIEEINANSGSEATFVNRFFRWFNAFRIVKFMNFASSGYYPKQPVSLCAGVLLKQMGYNMSEHTTALQLLMEMRKIERNNSGTA
jgi:hypothetical protein